MFAGSLTAYCSTMAFGGPLQHTAQRLRVQPNSLLQHGCCLHALHDSIKAQKGPDRHLAKFLNVWQCCMNTILGSRQHSFTWVWQQN